MSRTKTGRDGPNRVPGDPGVGGLLADPEDPPAPHDAPDPAGGAPSPDPGPPRNHGDWMPTSTEEARKARRVRQALLRRRQSGTGMPLALFREDDGTSLADLRGLEREARAWPYGKGSGGGLGKER